MGGGLCVVFLLLQMLAQSGEKWEWLRYLTPLTAFDSAALASAEKITPMQLEALEKFIVFGGEG